MLEIKKPRRPRLRMQVLTHRAIQLKIAGIFALSFMIFLGFITFLFVQNYQHITTTSNGLEPHDSLMAKLLLVKQSRDLLWRFGLATLAYLTCISSYMMIYIHRMTGPIHKLTKVLEQAVKSRDWPKNLKFRKSDAFPELEEQFNYFLIAFGDTQSKYDEGSVKKLKRYRS